jgi:uncharacterized protein YutE (UPF0331/DUF86 family)
VVQRDVAAGKVARASARLDEAAALFADAPTSDLRSQDLASFYLFLAIQECIDLAAHWVADKNWGPPEDAAGSFEILVRRGALDDDLGEQMIQAVGLRNRIAHGYATLDHERLRRELDRGAEALRQFLACVASEAGL